MAQEYWRWSEESWINPDLNDWKGACLTAGVDIGSTSTQAVVMADKKPLSYASIRTGSNSKDSAVNAMNRVLELTGLQREEIAFTVGTGYGRVNVPRTRRELYLWPFGPHHSGYGWPGLQGNPL